MTTSEQLQTRPAADDASLRVGRIDMCGRDLAFATSGEGAPTVVLETGLGAESVEWAAVQAGLDGFVQVFRYDRAGRGDSDPAHRPRTARQMVEDLRRLLERAGVPGPYVLVGHSFGGLLVRLFAHLYRDQVVGLVLADSMHEDQFDVFGPTFPPPTPGESPVLRDVRAFWTEGWKHSNSTVEGIDFPTSIAQAKAIAPFGDLPLRVITAGTYLNQPLLPQPARPILQGMWVGLQKQFLALSSSAEQIMDDSSGHFIQRDAPDVVVDAICQVVSRVRASRS